MKLKPSDLARADDPHAIIRELMRRDFVSFLIRAFPYISGGAELDVNWHLDAIAYELERVRDGSCRRLLVTLPPRNLKSIMISVAWVAWRLGQDPRLNFVCISYSDELALKHARDCRSIMQASWYKELFPRTIISKGRSAVHDFQTTLSGGRLTTSINGTLTGRGGDIIIIDDPIKPDDAMSDTVRTKVNDWYFTTLASRLNNRRSGVIITVMQRLHQYDVAGMLLETGAWDHLSLPALAPDDANIPLTRGRTHRRLAGEALHPGRDSIADLLREKRMIGSSVFAAQYQQDPVPAEGNLVKAPWLKTYDATPERGLIVQSWDTASKDGIFNDWSVCITASVVKNDVYILDVWRQRVEFPDLKRASVHLARAHTSDVMLIEDQASGTQLYQTLLNESPRGVPQPIKIKPEGDKVTRLSGVSAMIEAGQLLLPREAHWLAEFKQELLAFPSSRYKDQVDALSQLLTWAGLHQRSVNNRVSNVGPLVSINGQWFGDEDFIGDTSDYEWL